MTVAPMGLDSLYPSDSLIFQAIRFRQTVKSLGQRASPFGWTLSKFDDVGNLFPISGGDDNSSAPASCQILEDEEGL